jgi:sortase A
VATDGTWDSLHNRSMVHYTGTPAPGQQGNSIIAFHREPDYEHIDQLNVGDTVSVQDRTCHTFVYRVTGRWTLNPSSVNQLVPTSGHDLTLITCTPFWVDSQRIVWRASLVTPTS